MASFRVVSKEEFDSAEDDRSRLTMRSLTSELGCLSRQDGSASLSQGDTTALAVVYGPAEVRIVREQIDKATVEITYKPKVGLPKPIDRKRECILRNTFDAAIITNLHPRSSISIIVQETEDIGSCLACCINAACMALLDAAVSMKFMIAAVAVSVLDSGEVVVDPVKKVEDAAVANMTFVFESVESKVLTVVTNGKFTQELYKKCLDITRQASQTVFEFYRESLSKKVLKCV